MKINPLEYGLDEDKPLGLKTMEDIAQGGFGNGLRYLAEYYSDPSSDRADYAKAVNYIERMDYIPPATKLTLAHLKRIGEGTPQDLTGAFKLYQDAANGSYNPAKLALAHMHRLGLGTPKDPQKAKALYEAARYDERHAASYYIGLMHELGELGPANMKEAINLYELASEAEYGPAFLRLAIFYETGQHVPKDTTKAFKLMTEASYEGDPEAIENMVRYYSEGIGTERSSEYAAIWRSKKKAQPPFAFN